jgi:WD40 repeat protein
MYLLSGHAGCVNSVGFSADGSKVVSGSDDKTVKIWNADSGEVIQTLSGEIDKDIHVSYAIHIFYLV